MKASGMPVWCFVLFVLLVLSSGCGTNDNGNGTSEKTVLLAFDSNYCLESHNSEAVVSYTNADYRSLTLLWNCGNYNDYYRKRLAILVLSGDGGLCYNGPTMILDSEGICESAAAVPDPVDLSAVITGFQPVVNNVSSVSFSGTFANTGNVDYLGLVYEIFPGIDDGGFGSWFGMPVGGTFETVEWQKSMSPRIPAGTYVATLNLKLWDGTILSTETATYTIGN